MWSRERASYGELWGCGVEEDFVLRGFFPPLLRFYLWVPTEVISRVTYLGAGVNGPL